MIPHAVEEGKRDGGMASWGKMERRNGKLGCEREGDRGMKEVMEGREGEYLRERGWLQAIDVTKELHLWL